MPLEKITTSQLSGFHRQWLARYELPLTSQRLLSYLFDRDAGASGLASLAAGNPAILALLSQAFDDRMPSRDSELRTAEFYISRLGLETVRKIILAHQMRGHFQIVLGLESRNWHFRQSEHVLERVERLRGGLSYADSAFVAGFIWDLLEPQRWNGRQKVWLESRLALSLERLDLAIALAEEMSGFPARRWVAGCISAVTAVDAMAGLLDSSFMEQVLSWERQKLPAVVQATLKARHIGFSTFAAGAWICERLDVLRPMADSVRYLDVPRALEGASPELRRMSELLGRATEMC